MMGVQPYVVSTGERTLLMPLGGGAWVAMVAAPFIGSFLGVLALRLPEGAPVLFDRSACPACAHVLGPRDLVPVASWLSSRGTCRHCHAPVGLFYPIIELAALAVAVWASFALSGWQLWAGCGLGWTLLALAAMDQRCFILSDKLTLPLIPAGLAVTWFDSPADVADHVLGAAAGFGSFWLVAALYRRLRGRDGLGLGDAKLLAAGGAWASWEGLPSIVLIGAVAALAVAAGSALLGRRMTAQARLPFGPFLCFAIWWVWLYGPLTGG
jgi:leader peptidase (prepilin peptidase) / N-methyltransferase